MYLQFVILICIDSNLILYTEYICFAEKNTRQIDRSPGGGGGGLVRNMNIYNTIQNTLLNIGLHKNQIQ